MLQIEFKSDTKVTGTLFMDAQRVRRLTALLPSGICVTQCSQPDRDQVERFIEETYQRHFGAQIQRHYPNLMSVYDSQGKVLAAVGFRPAAQGPLFLEHYLRTPVEEAIGSASGIPVGRESIVEIGNLTSAGRGASVFLFVALAAYLRQRNLVHAVVTGTSTLRRTFTRLGIEFLELASADPSALEDDGASWGSYYRCDPKVIAGRIQPAFARLEPYLPARHNSDLGYLISRLHPPAVKDIR
jgi:Thermostable hemolysin